jgi:hypothetical protein
VGVRFLFLSAYIDYLRFFGGDAGANLISFNFGGDSAISLTKSWKLVLRLSGTFYYGTLDSASRPDATTAGQVNDPVPAWHENANRCLRGMRTRIGACVA